MQEIREKVFQTWQQLPKHSALRTISSNWWQKLDALYSSSRSYHNLLHLHEMTQLLQQNKEKISRNDLVTYAIFFHDLVYEPTENDNEEKSAEAFTEFAKEITLDIRDSRMVSNWILQTKSHLKTQNPENDLSYFLDFDLAILSSNRKRYEEYCLGIRREYKHVPYHQYCEARAAVLDKFLSCPRLYFSDDFHLSRDLVARENLRWEIDLLKSKSLFCGPKIQTPNVSAWRASIATIFELKSEGCPNDIDQLRPWLKSRNLFFLRVPLERGKLKYPLEHCAMPLNCILGSSDDQRVAVGTVVGSSVGLYFDPSFWDLGDFDDWSWVGFFFGVPKHDLIQ
eukprot:TRINITY_DN8245_c0_g1_i1.p1 TRINITY_DN8245_c0_g1~~TRINITY_DN8245_c0_g1_i1.p1  ORF type:complete len:339 (-),score=50.43 TRINITY_DN8245_c0_g1_i1:136-1152(-)